MNEGVNRLRNLTEAEAKQYKASLENLFRPTGLNILDLSRHDSISKNTDDAEVQGVQTTKKEK